MRKDEILGLAIILATVVAIMLVYSNLPAEITTNWDSNGQAFGTMHKKLFVVGSLASIFLILKRRVSMFSLLGSPQGGGLGSASERCAIMCRNILSTFIIHISRMESSSVRSYMFRGYTRITVSTCE